jgi:hypothetical protein
MSHLQFARIFHPWIVQLFIPGPQKYLRYQLLFSIRKFFTLLELKCTEREYRLFECIWRDSNTATSNHPSLSFKEKSRESVLPTHARLPFLKRNRLRIFPVFFAIAMAANTLRAQNGLRPKR